MDLDQKVVLVAGGTGVLGSLIAREMALRGARLVLAARDQQALERTASQFGEAVTCRLDLTHPATIPESVEVALRTYGRLDGLVNAAGVVAFGGHETTPASAIEQLVATNLTGPLLLIQAAIPHIEDGFIVNLTGVVAEQPVGGMVAYSAAKAGLSAAATALTRELRRRKTLVVDVRAPHTETGLASRPIAGSAPNLPEGLAPESVAKMIVDAVEMNRRSLEPADFRSQGPA